MLTREEVRALELARIELSFMHEAAYQRASHMVDCDALDLLAIYDRINELLTRTTAPR